MKLHHVGYVISPSKLLNFQKKYTYIVDQKQKNYIFFEFSKNSIFGLSTSFRIQMSQLYIIII